MASTNRRRGVDTQASSSALPARQAQRRGTRASSVISEADSVGSAAPPTRGRATAKPKPAPRGGKKPPTLLEESDEEEGVMFSASNSGTSRAATGTGTGTGSSRRTRGDDASASASASASVSATGRVGKAAQASSSVTVGRRKLLVEEDDEDDSGPVSF
jgi:hypothetical protein